jgi:hypothetical protein
MRSLELALIGNGRIGLLVDSEGTIVWGCFPRFDGDPTFCALLDDAPRDTARGIFSIETGRARKSSRLTDFRIFVYTTAPAAVTRRNLAAPLRRLQRAGDLPTTPPTRRSESRPTLVATASGHELQCRAVGGGGFERVHGRPVVGAELGHEFADEWPHKERIVARRNIHMHPKRFELCSNDRTDSRDGDAFQASLQFRFSTRRAGDVAKSSNLRRAGEGDRVDPAGSHLGDDGDHAGIVRFRGVHIREHRIRLRTGSFDETQKPLIRITGIELDSDAAPGQVVPRQRRDNPIGRGFVRGNVRS